MTQAKENTGPNEPGGGAEPLGLRTDTLATSVAVLLAVTVIQRGIGFGRGVLFCRWLDPHELGQWELACSFLLLAAPLAVLGLPGSFGRYVEHYRQRGQLRTFLRRTAIWTALFGALAVALVIVAAPHFSRLIFGAADTTTLVFLMAGSLGAIILHHSLEALLAALRMFRVVSLLQFCHSVVFAGTSIALLLLWRLGPAAIVIAYGAASLLAAAGALLKIRSALRPLPAREAPLPRRAFWLKLLQFSVWLWLTNLLFNLFLVVDRYMIVHYSGLGVAEAIAQVGQYHSSRVIPLLIVSVVELVASMITPYLSCDWEAGRRDLVGRRLNLALKLVGFGTLLASVAILWLAPLLFDVAFGGKYQRGLAILPWTLCYCSLIGILSVGQNYLWCAEKARWCSLPLVVGLAGNVCLNLVLLPRLGLLGAVLATAVANLAALILTLLLSRLAGMAVDRATWLLAVAPVAVGCGLIPAAVVALALLVAAARTDWLLDRDEKRQLAGALAGYVARLTRSHRRAAADG